MKDGLRHTGRSDCRGRAPGLSHAPVAGGDYQTLLGARLPRIGAVTGAAIGLGQLLHPGVRAVDGALPANVVIAGSLIALTAAALYACVTGLARVASAVGLLVLLAAVAMLVVPADIAGGVPLPGVNACESLAALGMGILSVGAWPAGAGLAGSIALSVGLVAFTGNLLGVSAAFAWAGQAPMPLGTSLAVVLVATGLVASAIASQPRSANATSTLGPALLGFTAATCGVLFWYALRVQEINQIHRTVDAATTGVRAEIEGRMGSMALALQQLASHGRAAGWESVDAWRSDARLTVGAFPGFEAVEYIDRDIRRRLVTMPEPGTQPEPPMDADAERLLHTTVERAGEARTPVVSGPFNAFDGQRGFRVVTAVERDGSVNYLSGLFSASQTFAPLFRNLAPGYSVLIRCGDGVVFSRGFVPAEDGSDTWSRLERLELNGPLPWYVEVTPSPALLSAQRTGLPQIALGSSLLIALLLGLTARFGALASGRARTFMTAVRDRTEELQKALDVLAEENRERERSEQALRSTQDVNRLLSGELDLEKVVQAVTDAATQLTGAEAGAFFYQVHEGAETRFAISGAERSAFDHLPLPKGHGLLGATLSKAEVVLCNDVREDERYGRTPPHYGLPKGHPVKVVSYLAVPVVSRTGTIWGALVFAHSEPGMFGAHEREVVIGLAAQAGIAMENASLYAAEQRANAEAQSANRAKDRFLAMLSHELRNPLSSITTALEVVGSRKAEPEQRDRMRQIASRQVEHLSRMVDDLLDVSRIEQGRLALQFERFNFGRLLRDHCEAVGGRFREAGLRFETSLSQEPMWVDGDSTRLAQVIDNLLSNAIKFTPEGGEVRVTAQVDEATNAVVVEVRDNGRGLAAEDARSIFEPFVQADVSLDRAAGGLGLGLTIAARLVEAHGGVIAVSSDGLGRGACFEVTLPLRDAPEPREPRRKGKTVAAAGKRIVLIDDHRDSADGLAEVLRLRGHHVEVAYEGESGLNLVAQSRPDVVVCDIGLPGMDGFEVARRIHTGSREGGPFLIALTGYGDEDTMKDAKAAGFDHHMTKPVDVAALTRLLRKSDSA